MDKFPIDDEIIINTIQFMYGEDVNRIEKQLVNDVIYVVYYNGNNDERINTNNNIMPQFNDKEKSFKTISSKLKNGLLTIVLPKKEISEGREIPIK